MPVLKRSILFVIILVSAGSIPVTVGAHTVLEEAEPAAGSGLEEPVEQITLTFNSKLETGSSLTLSNAAGTTIEPASVNLDGQMLTAHLESPLTGGTYQVNWKVLGADGHIIEDSYSFTITTPEAAAETGTKPAAVVSEPAETKATAETEVLAEEEQEITAPADSTSIWLYGIIAFFIAAVLVLMAWLFRSRST